MPAEPHLVPESSAIETRPVLAALLAALVLLAGAVFALNAIYRSAVPVRTVAPPEKFPAPGVRVDERAEREAIVAAQRRRLGEYRWLDSGHARAQIPIERAMQIIAQKGANGLAPLIASPSALSSPTAGAERAVTPGAARAVTPGAARAVTPGAAHAVTPGAAPPPDPNAPATTGARIDGGQP